MSVESVLHSDLSFSRYNNVQCLKLIEKGLSALIDVVYSFARDIVQV